MAQRNGSSSFDETYQNLNYNAPCYLLRNNSQSAVNNTTSFPECEDSRENMLYDVGS